MKKDGTIETVADMIKCLKKCDPKAEIEVLPNNAKVTVVQEPGSNTAYIVVKGIAVATAF